MEKIWKSKDFYISSVLVATGANLISLEKKDKNFITFVLDISPSEAEKRITSHWNRTLALPTRDLIEAINELKTRLHSGM